VLLLLIGLFLWGVGAVAGRISGVLLPAALALILAYILDPVVEFFASRKMPRIWAILLVFLLGLLMAAGVVGSVIPGLIKESRKLAEELPGNAKALQLKLEDFMEHSPLGRQLPSSWRFTRQPEAKQPVIGRVPAAQPGKIEVPPANTNGVELSLNIKVTDKTNGANVGQTNGVQVSANSEDMAKALNAPISEMVVPGLARAVVFIGQWITARLGDVGIWLELLIGLVLVPIYLFYFLLEKKGITRSWTDYLPMQESKVKDEVVFVLRAINDCMIVFFRGQVLVASCVGVLLAVSYLILGLNYAVLLGLVAGLFGIVPYLGTIVSLVLALTVATVQFGDWTHPLCVLGIAAVVKLLEDLVISPKIIGNRSGLHPLTIIFAVMIGAKLLGGFLGALLAVPLTAALRTLMFRYVWKRRPAKAKSVKREEPAELVS
ncbi:MAG TPA: AI-2E family transporter, partial [Verrucomicrobiae bacterium]|nr:AI-2E family transporter [Verrucomicrobiae bacterium]